MLSVKAEFVLTYTKFNRFLTVLDESKNLVNRHKN